MPPLLYPAVRPPRVRLAAALLAGLLLACGGAGRPERLHLGHGLDTSHPVHLAMLRMAEILAERSGGSLVLEIHPGEQLGSERECLELLQIGSLALTKVSAAVLENFAPGFRVYSIPYLFRDEAHRFAVMDGEVGQALLLEPLPQRLRGLAYYDAGSRSFYTRDRAIRRPEDLEGLKIRTQESPSAVEMVRSLGGAATPLAWGELYTALQQGVVDGAENNPPSFHLSGHYEVARHYSLDEHTGVPDVLLVSTLVWERLSPEQRRWLEEAARESVPYQRELWRAATEEALRAVAEAGVEILRPDKAPFARRTASLRERYRRDAHLAALIRAVEATGT
jgi:tripartite ATP-independent transporter DctP family solute receptor